MSNKILGGLGILVAVGLVWFFSQTTQAPSPAPSPNPTPIPVNPTPVQVQPLELTSLEVVMSDTGFSPKEATIKKGSTVTFVNNSSKARWPASAPHPTHTDYSDFDARQAVAAGDSWGFTFQKSGTWRYHDHLQPTLFGSVTVIE